ncbi:MAG TPA: toll/interleukin-1 receptor domain-containing protein [Pseudonocardiaceae bacterium]|nr:toll/interleukin-1 receptor domain-containing protein [Pseudonocardiaceae bacterium]
MYQTREPDTRPLVFISYAHESDAHRADVEALAAVLAENDIVVDYDMPHTKARTDWGLWAERAIAHADFVIVVASDAYRRAAEGDSGNASRGVQSEAALLRELLHADRRAWLGRILPVVLPGQSVSQLPLFLQPRSASHFVLPTITPAGLTELLEVLVGRSANPVPAARPAWVRLTEPATVRWRTGLPLPDPTGSTIEVHLVPTAVPAQLPVRRLATLAVELAEAGRAARLFAAAGIGSSDQVAWAHDRQAGLALYRDGQRSGWFPLASGALGCVDLVPRVADLITVLLRLDLPTPPAVAPTIGLELRRRPWKRRQIRIDADECVGLVTMQTEVADVADELVSRLCSRY